MATFIDEEYYRNLQSSIDKELKEWDKQQAKFGNLQYVPAKLNEMRGYPKKVQDLLDKALSARAKEVKAEEELKTPSLSLYDLARKVYGGYIYFGLDSSLIEEVFPKGRPERKSTPPDQLLIVLKRIHKVFDGSLKGHAIQKEHGKAVKESVEKWDTLDTQESEAEAKALAARGELAECNQAYANDAMILRHLARADNVLQPGVLRAMFPVATKPQDENAVSEETEVSTETTDNPVEPTENS